jgi:hypothetical protein
MNLLKSTLVLLFCTATIFLLTVVNYSTQQSNTSAQAFDSQPKKECQSTWKPSANYIQKCDLKDYGNYLENYNCNKTLIANGDKIDCWINLQPNNKYRVGVDIELDSSITVLNLTKENAQSEVIARIDLEGKCNFESDIRISCKDLDTSKKTTVCTNTPSCNYSKNDLEAGDFWFTSYLYPKAGANTKPVRAKNGFKISINPDWSSNYSSVISVSSVSSSSNNSITNSKTSSQSSLISSDVSTTSISSSSSSSQLSVSSSSKLSQSSQSSVLSLASSSSSSSSIQSPSLVSSAISSSNTYLSQLSNNPVNVISLPNARISIESNDLKDPYSCKNSQIQGSFTGPKSNLKEIYLRIINTSGQENKVDLSSYLIDNNYVYPVNSDNSSQDNYYAPGNYNVFYGLIDQQNKVLEYNYKAEFKTKKDCERISTVNSVYTSSSSIINQLQPNTLVYTPKTTSQTSSKISTLSDDKLDVNTVRTGGSWNNLNTLGISAIIIVLTILLSNKRLKKIKL